MGKQLLVQRRELKYLGYESSYSGDSTLCNDEFTPSSFGAEFDLHNIMGITEGSKSTNLKAKVKRATNCAGNGSEGSTQVSFWYELNSKNRVTKMIYQRTFNGSSEVFQENYTYLNR